MITNSSQPVDGDEFNRKLAEHLTSFYKQKFLQYVRVKPNLLLFEPFTDLNIWDHLVDELNDQKLTCSQTEWMNMFRTWRDFVRKSPKNQVLMPEDEELLRYIRSDESKKSVSESPISEALKCLSTRCRICLASSSSKMLFLFEQQNDEQSEKGVTLLKKLNYCACFASDATFDDELPKYICLSCSLLVENAYQLKVLCTKTEKQFRKLCGNRKNDGDDTDNSQNDINTSIHAKQVNLNLRENSELTEINECDDNIQLIVVEQERLEPESESNRNEDTDKQDEEAKIISTRRDSSRHYRCDICTAVFSSKRGVEDHMDKKHKQDVVRKKSHECPVCKKLFRVKCSLRVHLRTHTGERPYKCEICGKSFKTTSAAKSHQITHTEAKDFQCEKCSFSTNTRANLQLHERIHNGDLPYSCQLCSTEFRTASNLAKHMRNIHEKQKSNKCDKCQRSFFTRESLRKHSIIHTGLKLFDCPGCSATYGWHSGLKKHIRREHCNGNVKLPSEKSFSSKIESALIALNK